MFSMYLAPSAAVLVFPSRRALFLLLLFFLHPPNTSQYANFEILEKSPPIPPIYHAQTHNSYFFTVILSVWRIKTWPYSECMHSFLLAESIALQLQWEALELDQQTDHPVTLFRYLWRFYRLGQTLKVAMKSKNSDPFQILALLDLAVGSKDHYFLNGK